VLKVKALFQLIAGLTLLTPTLANSQDLTIEEAALLLGRLSSNSVILEKIDPEKKARIVNSPEFQQLILRKQEQLLEERNVSELIQIKKIVPILFPEDSALRKESERLSQFGEKLEHYLATENVASLKTLLADSTLLARERRIASKQLVRLVHSQASESLKIKDSAKAIEQLGQLPPDLRNEETWGLYARFISDLVKLPGNLPLEGMIKNEDALLEFGKRDPGALDSIIQLYLIGLVEAAKRGDAKQAEVVINTLKRIQADTSEVIPLFLLEAEGAARSELAPKIFEEVRRVGSLPLGLKWKLMWRGYYGPLVPLLLSLSIAFPILGVAFHFLGRWNRSLSVKRVQSPQASKPPKKGKSLPGYLKPIVIDAEDTAEDEYSRLLALFDLNDSASENQIKQAYRTKMKELHPDSSPLEEVEDNSEKFRELKHAYDRIFQIRGSWFRGRKG